MSSEQKVTSNEQPVTRNKLKCNEQRAKTNKQVATKIFSLLLMDDTKVSVSLCTLFQTKKFWKFLVLKSLLHLRVMLIKIKVTRNTVKSKLKVFFYRTIICHEVRFKINTVQIFHYVSRVYHQVQNSANLC